MILILIIFADKFNEIELLNRMVELESYFFFCVLILKINLIFNITLLEGK